MKKIPNKYFIIGSIVVSLLLAGLISHLSAESDDGLMSVAGKLKFADREKRGVAPVKGMPDYQMKGLKSKFWSRTFPGILGVLAVLGLTWLIGLLIRRRRQ